MRLNDNVTPAGQTAGFLGKLWEPERFVGDPALPDYQIEGLALLDGITRIRIDRRRDLLREFESRTGDLAKGSNVEAWNRLRQQALDLVTSGAARAAFDLSRESEKVRDRYGRYTWGQSVLLARRLIEAGVRFVTVNTFLTVFDEITWDIHGSKPFTSIEGMKNIVAPMYDQAYATLIEDLSERGLLENTLVCNLAEFGRTPRINPAGGRDHWPQCWTSVFAGGGVQGGRVIGRSDPIGGYPAERPVEPAEVVATIYRSLGIELDTILPGPAGRPFPVVDFGKQEIKELF